MARRNGAGPESAATDIEARETVGIDHAAVSRASSQDPQVGPIAPATRRLDEIIVGERHRRDMGDIDGLVASIGELGLLHPVVVTPDGRLIAGERRIKACQALGWTEVPVNVADLDEIVRGEFAENAVRQDFLPSEIVSIMREIEPLERAAAKERQQSGLKRGNQKPVVQILHNGGKARDKIARFAGISGYQLDKIKTVMKAAEDEPERFGYLKEQIDRPHGVDKAFHTLRRARDQQRVLSLVPVPGKFRTLVLDPPWPRDDGGDAVFGRFGVPYACMERDKLLALPVAEWAEDDCHLYVWVTNSNMPLACECMAAWGFKHTSILTWVKPRLGMGSYFRGTTEHVLFGLRGKLRLRSTTIPTHFEAPTGGHSVKPEAFYDIVRRASYLPAGEAFQRKPRDGFVNLYRDGHGDQAPGAEEEVDPFAVPDFLLRSTP